jgi:hypothetical protein
MELSSATRIFVPLVSTQSVATGGRGAITSDAWRVCCEGLPAATDAVTEAANVRLVKRIDIGAVW